MFSIKYQKNLNSSHTPHVEFISKPTDPMILVWKHMYILMLFYKVMSGNVLNRLNSTTLFQHLPNLNRILFAVKLFINTGYAIHLATIKNNITFLYTTKGLYNIIFYKSC